ncbi:MAG: 2OG-Fe(II) oxygenase [Rhodobacteraceae bacterium]|nr:2OG-Fe(II) oxygenase [Paracoccaceae bacterium]
MGNFFRIETVDAEGPLPGTAPLAALRAGALHAVLLRHVYPAQAMAEAVQKLDANAPGFVRSDFPAAFKAFFYGLNLNLAAPDLAPYFAAEPAFRAALAGLLRPDAETRITGLLQALDDGRRYCAAPGPHPGARYFFTTLRGHGTGGFIPPHFDNESALRPSYRHLAGLIDPGIFSFVLAFSRADAGGALEFFNLRAEDHAARFRNVDGPSPPPSVEGVEKVAIRLAPGDMVVLNSGGYLHRVTPVEGPQTRWTACSFMAPSLSGDRVLCWG